MTVAPVCAEMGHRVAGKTEPAEGEHAVDAA